MLIKPIKKYNKTLTVPGDKSITHRAVMFGALAKGTTIIKGALLGADCLSTIDCMRKLGAEIKVDGNTVTVVGIERKENKEIIKLDVGNSGTTIRLLAGALAGIEGLNVELSGDESIVRRPMKRVVEPLRLMGADIECKGGEGLAPIVIRGKRLKGIDYVMPVASAQVKSAILLAGLNAGGETVVREKVVSRNHTEIMLRMFGCEVEESKEKGRENVVRVRRSVLRAVDVGVPADISSAAFAAVLAAVKGKVVLKNVGVNPTRTGILDVLEAVGASVVRTPTETTRPTEHHCHCEEFTTKQSHVKCSIRGIASSQAPRNDAANPLFAQEPIADITIQTSKLKPFVIKGDIIPRLIDEIPVLAVLACFVKGKSVIKDAAELKVKESNRIDTVVNMINNLGGSAVATPDGMIIDGKGYLDGGDIDAKGDHRIAMSGAVALALSKNGGKIIGDDCADVSYPDFFSTVV